MKYHYTKQQIVEAIKHWESVLKRINESKSPLLDACSKEFGEDVVFSNIPFSISDKNVNALYSILNEMLFDGKLHTIPVKCLTYESICAFDSAIYNKYKKPEDDEYKNPPISIYGMHSAIILNNIFKYNEPLMFAPEEIIYLNLSQLRNVSFSLYVSISLP